MFDMAINLQRSKTVDLLVFKKLIEKELMDRMVVPADMVEPHKMSTADESCLNVPHDYSSVNSAEGNPS